MEILINISKKDYQALKQGHVPFKMLDAIRNGIILPEEHGRLGDLDELEKDMINSIKAGNYEDGYDYPHINSINDCVDWVRYADTIIKAKKVRNKR